jgi:PAS domain S-box-containing protein
MGNERIQTAYKDVPYGLVYHDASTKVLACNKAAERILGIAMEEALGRDIYDPQWRIVRIDGSPLPVDEHPVFVCLKTRKPVQNVVAGIWNPAEGRARWLRLDVVPHFLDENGSLLGAFAWISDVTEDIEVGRAERRSRSLFRSLFDNMAEGVALHEIVFDESGRPSDYRIIDVNTRYESHVGITRDAAVGRLGSDVYGTRPAPYLEEYSRVALSGVPYGFETYFPPLDKHFLISVAPLEPGGFATIFFDISLSKQVLKERERLVGELERKNKELEELVYIASHDLRSPLINIQGFGVRLERDYTELSASLQAALEGSTEARDRIHAICSESMPRSLEFVRAGARKIDRLIAGLLRLSRIGRASLIVRELDMNSMLAEIVKAMSYQFEAAAATVAIDDIPRCLGDPDQVSQVFSNLLDNAVKYRSMDRPLVVTVKGRRRDAVSEYIVEDNGRGIEEGRIEEVWALFRRLEPNDGIEGEGLGLTLARRIVECLGGSIRAESKYGEGSRFIITLPAKGAGG